MKNVRIYCRASTDDQNAERALESLKAFADENNIHVVAEYIENESGAKLDRPQLNAMLMEAQPDEILLVESTDRLSRLVDREWDELKKRINDAEIALVIKDLPTTHAAMQPAKKGDDTTRSIMKAINSMLIDIMATMAREDYEKRRDRQKQGIDKAKAEGKYNGRPANIELREKVATYLSKQIYTMAEIAKLCDCSLGMVAKVKHMNKSEQ